MGGKRLLQDQEDNSCSLLRGGSIILADIVVAIPATRGRSTRWEYDIFNYFIGIFKGDEAGQEPIVTGDDGKGRNSTGGGRCVELIRIG